MPLTFLFTDLQGSSRLWEQHPAEMPAVIARHDALLRAAVEAHAGRVIKTTGDGLHAVFDTPSAAVAAVVEGQQALLREPWPPAIPVRVRMGLHTGEAEAREGDYFGSSVNRAARLMALAHGGQIVLSAATAALLADDLPPQAALRDLGNHRLRDLSRAEHVFQVLHPALPADFPPLASPDTFPNNLPATLTSFVGRERELAELPRLLGLYKADERRRTDDGKPTTDEGRRTTDERPWTDDGDHAPSEIVSHAQSRRPPMGTPTGTHAAATTPPHAHTSTLPHFPRLLTLIGPGGTGKTRLSLQLGSQLLPHFPDGAWLVELAPLADPEQVLTAVITALRLPAVPGLPPLHLLTNYLSAKRLLLILDNCEHLVEACARLADHLLRACPQLIILASSREALGIAGETIYRVAPLALPAEAAATPAALCRFDSVELFLERAAAVRPGFVLTDHNAPAVAQITRRLDGIPLALELAAARVRLLSPEQIALRLDDRFRLLTGGSRAALPRQQTLRALIDWSYDLLDTEERALLRQLSVFAGGWTLEAAEAICPEADVLTLLSQLADKSLVTVDDDTSGEPRYRLLETVRQYARDRLFESGEGEAARDRHLAYYLRWVEDGDHHMILRGSSEWSRRWRLEHDNCLAAFDWGLERDPDRALRLVGILADFWARREYMAQGRHKLKAALDRVADLPSVEGEAARQRLSAQARAWLGAANGYIQYSEQAPARAAMAESVQLYRAWAETPVAGQPGPLDQHPRLGLALAHQAFIAFNTGEPALALQCAQEAVAHNRATGDKLSLAYALGIRSDLFLTVQGDMAAARADIEEAVHLLGLEPGPSFGAAMARANLARLSSVQGDFETARQRLREALRILEQVDDAFALNIVRSELAHLERRTGQLDAARQLYRECVVVWGKFGHHAAAVREVECLAYIARAQGQPARAARLLGAAQAVRQRINAQQSVREQSEHAEELALLRAALPAEAYDAAWAEGQSLSLEQAIALALESGPI